jgi:hypothetical protein
MNIASKHLSNRKSYLSMQLLVQQANMAATVNAGADQDDKHHDGERDSNHAGWPRGQGTINVVSSRVAR